MKKLLSLAVVLALALPMVAWSASTYTSAFRDGKWDGNITSVIPELNGKKATMEVKHEGDRVTATITYPDGKEVWTWDEKTLTQKEIDLKTNNVAMQYGATAPATPAGTKQTFNVNCKNKAANECDSGIDSRNYWVLESTPTAIKYVVYGVPKEKKADPNAKPGLRHTFTFNVK